MCFSSDGDPAPAPYTPPPAPTQIAPDTLSPANLPNPDGTMPTKTPTKPAASSSATSLTIPLGGVTPQSALNVPQ